MGPDVKIDGGMSADEYKQLQSEERAWQEQLEDKKYERAMAYEQDQREYEEANKEKLSAQKNAEELAIEQGERAIQGEISAQDEDEDDESNMGMNFFETLATNPRLNPRPE